jgi:hypothetical protein
MSVSRNRGTKPRVPVKVDGVQVPLDVFAWNLQGGTVWEFADSMSLVVQYRALSVDYCDGTRGTSGRFCYDTITYGPVVGLAFRL